MKMYEVLSPVSISGKKYKIGACLELSDEQAKYGRGYIIEIPKAKLEADKNKNKSKSKVNEKTIIDTEIDENDLENDIELENDLINNDENINKDK